MRISDLSSGVCSSDLPLQAPEGEDLGRAPGFDDLALGIERVNRHVHLQRARSDTPGQDAAEEIVAVEQRDQELERSVLIRLGRRHMVDDGFEHRLQVARARVRIKSRIRSEEHTSELQSLMRISYAVFCLKKKNNTPKTLILNKK